MLPLGFPLLAVGVTLWCVGGVWAYGWRRDDVKVLAVIGGAWFGFLVEGLAGVLPGALYAVLVLIGWPIARRLVRLVRRVAPSIGRGGRWAWARVSNASELRA